MDVKECNINNNNNNNNNNNKNHNKNKYKKKRNERSVGSFEFVVFNPATFSGNQSGIPNLRLTTRHISGGGGRVEMEKLYGRKVVRDFEIKNWV